MVMDGVLIVDKPSGMTSHDVVDAVRKRYHIPKVGHAGTLDPAATGVLVLLLGRATKDSARLSGDDKEYAAAMVLGARSDTGDREGKITPVTGVCPVDPAGLETVLHRFTGIIRQTPPMYSAIKIKGRKMCDLARRGITVERSARTVTIRTLTLLDFKWPRACFKVACSKGTYIRQLAVDIGDALGCGAYLDELRRTRSGCYGLDAALPFNRVLGLGAESLARHLHSP